MTVKYSLDLNQRVKPCKSKICKACGLYVNQLPAYDTADASHVFWVGLSAVQFEEGAPQLPLSSNTRSGALIEKIENPLTHDITFYKTNIVKCLPLKDDGKIRYPLEHEMEKCFPNFEFELTVFEPSIVFLLGKQVASFVMKKIGISEVELPEDFKYKPIEVLNTLFVPIHHPSYILVYKRKHINTYIKNIQRLCTNTLVELS